MQTDNLKHKCRVRRKTSSQRIAQAARLQVAIQRERTALWNRGGYGSARDNQLRQRENRVLKSARIGLSNG